MGTGARAAVRGQRRRFEAGEVHEDADAPVDVPDRRNELVLVGVTHHRSQALWGGGVVGLVTQPDAALGDRSAPRRAVPRAAIWMVLITATVAGCLAVLVSVRENDARRRSRLHLRSRS